MWAAEFSEMLTCVVLWLRDHFAERLNVRVREKLTSCEARVVPRVVEGCWQPTLPL